PRRSTGSAGLDTIWRGPLGAVAVWPDVAPLLPLAEPTRAASVAPPGSRVTGPDGAAPAPADPAAASRLAPTSAGAALPEAASAGASAAAGASAPAPSTFVSR